MSGTDSSPEKSDETGTPASPPTRGIDPPTSGFGPPPAPDFGVDATRWASNPPAPVNYAAYSASGQPATAPQRASRPWALAAIIAAIVAVFVLVLGIVVFGISSVLTLAGDPGEAAPSSETDDSGQGPMDSGSDSGAVETSLQAMIDEYKTARDNGSLWTSIPDTAYNRTAVSAFLYFLTDMKIAASFGGDTSDYQQRADELERKLLNEEPLGSDISIKLSDRTFTYDGDTGEGGYTNN